MKALVLDVAATPTSANASRLDATVNLATDKMGTVNGSGSAVLVVDAKGGMALDERQPLRAKLDADIADLAWVSLFVGDSMEVGGTVKANLEAQGTLAGKWSASGNIRGDKLRVVRIDDGVRLIDLVARHAPEQPQPLPGLHQPWYALLEASSESADGAGLALLRLGQEALESGLLADAVIDPD